MATKIQKLQDKAEEVARELAAAEKLLGAAQKALQTDETNALIDDRPVDSKLKKKAMELQVSVGEIEGRQATIARAITEVRQRDEAEKGQREYDAREALKKSLKPQLTRLRAAVYEVRNATQEAFAILEQPDNFRLVAHDHAEIIFPPQDIHDRYQDMTRRTCQLEMLNAAIGWIRHDAMFSRTGPQKP